MVGGVMSSGFSRVLAFCAAFCLPCCVVLLLAGCASLGTKASDLSEIKYFAFPKQAPVLGDGEDEIRLTAAVKGKLRLDQNKCLRIGAIIPVLHRENIIGFDQDGFFMRHEAGTTKYRLGDKVSGGGGYSAALERFNEFGFNGASTEICQGEFASFYLSYPQ